MPLHATPKYKWASFIISVNVVDIGIIIAGSSEVMIQQKY